MKQIKLMVLLGVLLLPLLSFQAVKRSAAQDPSCPELVHEALSITDSLCQQTGRNQICYGHSALQAQPQPDVAQWKFDQEGDIEEVTRFQSLRLSVMDVDAGAWGVTLMRLQASLPDSQPDKNVTVVLFGDVEIMPQENTAAYVEATVNAASSINVRQSPALDASVVARLDPGQPVTVTGRLDDTSWVRIDLPDEGGTGWVAAYLLTSSGDLGSLAVVEPAEPSYGPMQAFYFSSGQDDAACDEAPDSGLLVQTPEGVAEVTLLINEVNIQLGSTVYLQAQPDGDMTIRVIEGAVKVSAEDTTVEVATGMQTTIPLTKDLKPAGAPTTVVPFDPESVRSLPLSLLDEPVELPASVEGEETLVPTTENPADVQTTSEDASEGGTPAARKTTIPPTAVVPTSVVPTAEPPTAEPPTAEPPTAVPPTAEPPTAVPPTAEPPTAIPPTEEEKVTICHKGKNTLTIGISALPAHLAHGDTMGACP
jgi:hypothetical protein